MCFLQKKYSFEDFFKEDKEAVFFDSKEELVSKINFYTKKDYLIKKIAKSGHKKYHSLFNATLVTKYMLSKILSFKKYTLALLTSTDLLFLVGFFDLLNTP